MKKNNINNILIAMLCVSVFIIYLILPPRDKVAQIGYSFNNLKYYLGGQDNTEAYKFYRNNAVYLAKMNRCKDAIKEMDKSIASVPENVADHIIDGLYKDRAEIEIFQNDYRNALNDFLRASNLGINDYLKVAMLLKENGKYKTAVSYCNKIIDIDIKAYAGYACLADIYANLGKYEAAVAIFDLLIDRSAKGRYYADRAIYKQMLGDRDGYNSDMDKAKELSPVLDIGSSITYDVIHPKKLMLQLY